MTRRTVAVGTITPDRVRIVADTPAGPQVVTQRHPDPQTVTRLFRLLENGRPTS